MITPGMRIKAKRKELGLSQVQLAAMAGIKQSSLSELETGESKMPSAEALMGLSKALNVSKTWILTGKDGELEFLTQEEQLHIQSVRGLSAEQKRALYDLVSTFTGHKEE